MSEISYYRRKPNVKHHFPFFSIASRLKRSTQPIEFFNLLKSFLEAIDAKDPNLFHYEIARKTLAILDEGFLANENAIDRLARQCLNHCHELKQQFSQTSQSYPIQQELFFLGSSLFKIAFKNLKQKNSFPSSVSYAQNTHSHFGFLLLRKVKS